MTVPTTTARVAPGSIVLDVFPVAPLDLRRGLQAQGTSARLPGGVRLDETATGDTYVLEAEGGWEVVQHAGSWLFRHADGHVVELGSHGVKLRPAQ